MPPSSLPLFCSIHKEFLQGDAALGVGGRSQKALLFILFMRWLQFLLASFTAAAVVFDFLASSILRIEKGCRITSSSLSLSLCVCVCVCVAKERGCMEKPVTLRPRRRIKKLSPSCSALLWPHRITQRERGGRGSEGEWMRCGAA